jgi:predicted TIM-barrel fold metal-dependent hydrolase
MGASIRATMHRLSERSHAKYEPPHAVAGRRRALGVLASLALPGAMQSAFGAPDKASASSGGTNAAAPTIRPILKPLRINQGVKPTQYCIDVHAHIFNASDIDVVGFMKKDVGHKFLDTDIARFIDGMAAVAGQLQATAISAAQELLQLRQFVEKLEGAIEGSLASALDSFANPRRKAIAGDIAHAMKERPWLVDLYLKLKREQIEELRKVVSEKSIAIPAPKAFDEETVLNAIDPGKRIREYDQVTRGLPGLIRPFNPDGTIEIVGHMLSYRWMNLRDYTRFYTEDAAAFGVDAMFASFVNFDRWLGIADRSPQTDQMELHAFLSKLSGGYMLPIVAYNPWTDIAENDASFRLVRDAVLNHGFIGVKIYPPTGFFPYGNGSLHYPTNESHPDLKALDAKLLQMISWCAHNNVPVMAHSAESNGRDSGSDAFGGPQGWQALLHRVGSKSPVIGTLAHFGGGESASAATPNNWPRRFAEMMASPEGRRLFGDLAYWNQVQDCSRPPDECEVAKERLKAAFTKNPAIAKRLMFGTDWDMLSQETRWDAYPSKVVENLRDVVPDMKAFLYLNALRCFGLGARGAQRGRVLAQLGQVQGRLPEWLDRAPDVGND